MYLLVYRVLLKVSKYNCFKFHNIRWEWIWSVEELIHFKTHHKNEYGLNQWFEFKSIVSVKPSMHPSYLQNSHSNLLTNCVYLKAWCLPRTDGKDTLKTFGTLVNYKKIGYVLQGVRLAFCPWLDNVYIFPDFTFL